MYLHQCIIGEKVKIVQRICVNGKGLIKIGTGSQLGVYPSPGFSRGEFYLEARGIHAEITIGNNVFINNNCIIIADKSSVHIGNNTLIGPNFVCFDSNFHSLDPNKRLSTDYSCKPVVIGSNVFIGEGVKILRGVCIGDNSVLAAGSIVVKSIPANTIFPSGEVLK
ncbi:MAG: DapH/DapD/GlmU-related protein [Iodobacter sp.]